MAKKTTKRPVISSKRGAFNLVKYVQARVISNPVKVHNTAIGSAFVQALKVQPKFN